MFLMSTLSKQIPKINVLNMFKVTNKYGKRVPKDLLAFGTTDIKKREIALSNDQLNIYININIQLIFKVNYRNTRTRCVVCSKLIIKTPE